MATTNLNIKTDILRTSIHEHGIPFALKLDIPNEITIASIEEGRKLMADSSATRYSDVDSLREVLEVKRNLRMPYRTIKIKICIFVVRKMARV